MSGWKPTISLIPTHPYMVSYYCLIVTYGLTRLLLRYKLSKSEWLWYWPFKITELKCNRINGLPMYALLLMFNSNMHVWSNPAPLQDIRLRNLEWPWRWPFKSFKVNVMGSFDSPCMVFYWYSNSYLSHPLAHIATQNTFPYLLSLGCNDEKSQMHQMTRKWSWTLRGQTYNTYVLLVPASLKFQSVLLQDCLFSR